MAFSDSRHLQSSSGFIIPNWLEDFFEKEAFLTTTTTNLLETCSPSAFYDTFLCTYFIGSYVSLSVVLLRPLHRTSYVHTSHDALPSSFLCAPENQDWNSRRIYVGMFRSSRGTDLNAFFRQQKLRRPAIINGWCDGWEHEHLWLQRAKGEHIQGRRDGLITLSEMFTVSSSILILFISPQPRYISASHFKCSPKFHPCWPTWSKLSAKGRESSSTTGCPHLAPVLPCHPEISCGQSTTLFPCISMRHFLFATIISDNGRRQTTKGVHSGEKGLDLGHSHGPHSFVTGCLH